MSTKAKNYVTSDTFSAKRVIFKDIIKRTDPITYQQIPIRYKYEDGEEGPLLIRTHEMFSFGVLENRDTRTDQIRGYSMPFVTYDSIEGKTEADTKFIDMIEEISQLCRKEVVRNGYIDKLSILKTKDDDSVRYAPALFAKILTQYNQNPLVIETPFKKKMGRKIRTIDPLSMVRKKCKVCGAIKIDNIFLRSAVQSIQTKLAELLVVEEIKTSSVFSDMSDDESDTD